MASTYKVKVKHGKTMYKDVELDTSESPEEFRIRLFSLTSVPPDAQQISIRGKKIKDDWSAVKLRNNAVLLLIGSAEEAPSGPAEPVIFLEDLTPEQRGELVDAPYPAGLNNLGNTCYMNSCVQVLKAVPELQYALKDFKPSSGDVEGQLVKNFHDLVVTLGKSHEPAYPLVFLAMLKQVYPQFDRKTDSGAPMQHDADECLSNLMDTLKRKSPALPGVAGSSAIEQLFEGKREVSWKCVEAPDEVNPKQSEPFSKLRCHIDGQTRFLVEGLRSGMKENLTKNSTSLGRNSVYQRSWKISQLPYYAVVQFVRFYWKEKAGVRNKIVRPVQYPENLDLFDFCTEDLQKELKVRRDHQQSIEDAKYGFSKKKKEVEDMDTSEDQDKSESKEEGKELKFEDLPDPGEFQNTNGLYELVAVLTHKGLSAEGGHYVAFVRNENARATQKDKKGKEVKMDEWLLFDDDRVSPKTTEQVLRLSGKGGPEDHIAYICLYRTKNYNPPKATKIVESKPEDETK